jgi:hypothetical protein
MWKSPSHPDYPNILLFFLPKIDIMQELEQLYRVSCKIHLGPNLPFCRWIRISRKSLMTNRICQFAKNQTNVKIIRFGSKAIFATGSMVIKSGRFPFTGITGLLNLSFIENSMLISFIM